LLGGKISNKGGDGDMKKISAGGMRHPLWKGRETVWRGERRGKNKTTFREVR